RPPLDARGCLPLADRAVAHRENGGNPVVTTDYESSGMDIAQGSPLPPTLRVLRYHFYTYLRTWRSSLTVSFLAPVLYLAAMGVSLGSLINHHVGSVQHVPYLTFVAPGLLAASAM